ncbi:MAG: magnesium and cobalt transport protein CorA, partial [Galactobacter sp.]
MSTRPTPRPSLRRRQSDPAKERPGAFPESMRITRFENGEELGAVMVEPENQTEAITRALREAAGEDLPDSAFAAAVEPQESDADTLSDGTPTNRLVVLSFDHPSDQQVDQFAGLWDLHPLLVEDLKRAGQRPKLERYDGVLFVVTRAAGYVDSAEDVVFTEFHLLARDNVVVIIRQASESGSEDFVEYLRGVPRDPELLRLGAEAVVHSFLDAVVDGYFPVLQGLTVDREQIERQVFDGDRGVTERVYRLSKEVIDLQHAAAPLRDVLDSLRSGFGKYAIPDPLRAYLQDVTDHLSRVNTAVTELREALNQILQVNATLVSAQQNEDMKKISGWAAILFAPTLIGAIYGMNFDVMPELHWAFGYPLAIGAMVVLAVGL